jgi:hypothetical protein
MKKIILYLPFTVLLLSSTCKKSTYSCECTASNGTNGGYAVQSQYYGDISQTSASSQCSSWINVQQANLQQAGGTASVNCVVVEN